MVTGKLGEIYLLKIEQITKKYKQKQQIKLTQNQ